MTATPWRPTAEEIAAGYGRAIPDVVAANLRVLFCGINPGLYSGATGRHFARPGNRFWRSLHLAGFSDRELTPWDDADMLAAGFGVTNLVNRATATAAELSPTELRAGADRLLATAERYRPGMVAVVGISAYRLAFERPKATIGRQAERLAPSGLWVLPNPSGLNAHYQLPALAEAFRQLFDSSSPSSIGSSASRPSTLM
ncbi:MAG: G/U mismatch-specific DNA glycosylase [Chloroflexi bacterium]|nr:G/U mismatch-specific DNA glycosylase [Chloroflexota bacterium]